LPEIDQANRNTRGPDEAGGKNIGIEDNNRHRSPAAEVITDGVASS
jgi:hypothetical protein